MGKSKYLERNPNCPICGEKLHWTELDGHIERDHPDFDRDSRSHLKTSIGIGLMAAGIAVSVPVLWWILSPDYFSEHWWDTVMWVLLGVWVSVTVFFVAYLNIVLWMKQEKHRKLWQDAHLGASPRKSP